MSARFAPPASAAVPIWFVDPHNWDDVRATIGDGAVRFAESCGFKPKAGRMQMLPGADGQLAGVLFGVAADGAKGCDPMATGKLATTLPEGIYRFANAAREPELAALAFLLASYRFERYRADPSPRPQLAPPEGVEAARVERIADAIEFGRDLVNTPANDLGPAALEAAAARLAEQFGARFEFELGGKRSSSAICR